jgi:hypothetical protein
MNYLLNDTPASLDNLADAAAQAPKLLIDASLGQVDGALREKGLYLTKEEIIDLHRYEQKALSLPILSEGVSAYLGYEEGSAPGRGLEVSDFTKTFRLINTHARKWDGLRTRIKLISSELTVFANNLINADETLADVLSTTTAGKSLREQGIRTVKDLNKLKLDDPSRFPGFELNADDTAAAGDVGYFLKQVLNKVEEQRVRTEQLKRDLEQFSLELATDVRPAITRKLTAIDKNSFQRDVLVLQEEIEQLAKEIDEKTASYKKLVNDSLSSASSMNLVGLGMAIYQGVEAEKVRKERNQRKKERDEKNAVMHRKSTVLARLNEIKADFQELEQLTIQADAAAKNVVLAWLSLHYFINASSKEAEFINDGLSIARLVFHFKDVVTPWHDIRTKADELNRVFVQAEQEILNKK